MYWYLYIVECNDRSLYTGITLDVKRRVNEHNRGKGAVSLIPKRPVHLVYKKRYRNHKSAAQREREIKKWTRDRKLRLVKGNK